MTLYLRPAGIVPKRTRSPTAFLAERTRVVRLASGGPWHEFGEGSRWALMTRCGCLIDQCEGTDPLLRPRTKLGAVTCPRCAMVRR